MSCELVFISPHKNGAVCVRARALQHEHRVTESIMGNSSKAGESGRKREKRKGRIREEGIAEDVSASLLLISAQIRVWKDAVITEAVLTETRTLQR